MKAVHIEKQIGAEPPALVGINGISITAPQDGEVWVRLHAISIPPGGQDPFSTELCGEFSGVIEAVGSDVEMFQIGDAVYGVNGRLAGPARPGCCVASASAISCKPRLLDHVLSATVPLSALTAWQGLLEKAGLQSRERLLICGAEEGAGLFAVQLARWRGAHVTATASPENAAFIRTLGADEVIDFPSTRFEHAARDADVVFDCAGGQTPERSRCVIAQNGRLLTMSAPGTGSAWGRNHDAFLPVRPDGSQLAQIAKLIDAGELRAYAEAVFPLADASQARQLKTRGNIVLKLI